MKQLLYQKLSYVWAYYRVISFFVAQLRGDGLEILESSRVFASISGQDHPRDQLLDLIPLSKAMALQEVDILILLQQLPKGKEMHLLKNRLKPILHCHFTLLFYLEGIGVARVVEVVDQRSDEHEKPLFLGEALLELLGSVVGLKEQLNRVMVTSRTEKAWVKLW